MIRNHKSLLAILVVLGWACSAPAECRFLLGLKDPSELRRVLNQYGLTSRGSAGDATIVSAPETIPTPQLLTSLRNDSAVRDVELDGPSKLAEPAGSARIVPDPAALAGLYADRSLAVFYGSLVRRAYLNQPAAALIENDLAHSSYATGAGVVAVIDTGVDPTHTGLFGSLVSGYDFIANQSGFASDWADLSPTAVGALAQSTVALLDGSAKPAILNQSTVALLDQSAVAVFNGPSLAAFGHGTMVAGLIHLAAPTAKIMPLRAFRADGVASLSNIIRAVYYAVDHGAKVINMSFSIADASPELKKAIDYASARNVICVASSGNDGSSAAVYPAAYSNTIAVGSTSNRDLRSTFSNFGSLCARTAAPGEGLVTFYPGNTYAAAWGTSFSSALVSGGMALMLQLAPHFERGDVMDALEYGKKIDNQKLGDSRLDLLGLARYMATKR